VRCNREYSVCMTTLYIMNAREENRRKKTLACCLYNAVLLDDTQRVRSYLNRGADVDYMTRDNISVIDYIMTYSVNTEIRQQMVLALRKKKD